MEVKSGNTGRLYFQRNQQYFYVGLIFIVALIFHFITAPLENKKDVKGSKDSVSTRSPDLDQRHGEKQYKNVFQSLPGDVFRIGIMVSTDETEKVEIFARSSLDRITKVGEWELSPSPSGEYKELIFSTAYRYEDIVLRLRDTKTVEEEAWDSSGVYIHSFFLSRIETRNSYELRNLQPTLFGISTVSERSLLVEKKKSATDNSRWIFRAEEDYIQSLEFFGEVRSHEGQLYDFEISRLDPETGEKLGKVLQNESFIVDELEDLRVSSGNYQLPFAFPLRSGEWYVVELVLQKPTDHEDLSVNPSIIFDANTHDFVDSGEIIIHTGEYTKEISGRSILDRARLEDLGQERSYSFMLHHEGVDYTNLYDASSSIVFDQKKNLILGSQKNGEFFSYKFDTIYPFDQFVLHAVQKGNDEREIKLEYSFDNAFWKEVNFNQEKGGPQRFFLSFPGNEVDHTVFVRASYNGEDMKSGFFALDELSVNASIPKY